MTSRSGADAGQGALAPSFGLGIGTAKQGLIPVSAARQRKLHVGHFAFMRSVVQVSKNEIDADLSE